MSEILDINFSVEVNVKVEGFVVKSIKKSLYLKRIFMRHQQTGDSHKSSQVLW
jgi:hypothetical protein